jgi:hypothetical protein
MPCCVLASRTRAQISNHRVDRSIISPKGCYRKPNVTRELRTHSLTCRPIRRSLVEATLPPGRQKSTLSASRQTEHTTRDLKLRLPRLQNLSVRISWRMDKESLIRIAMRELGRRTSEAKAAASRANGKKGGRPRKRSAKSLAKT